MSSPASASTSRSLSYALVEPLDWRQLRHLLWDALPLPETDPAIAGIDTAWARVAAQVNAHCQASEPVDAAQCRAAIDRIVATLPQASDVLTRAGAGLQVWNHLLYGIVQERFDAPEFMNLGYLDSDGRFAALALDEAEESHRLFIQMYERTIDGVDLRGRDVVEIGCGGGGGAHYIARRHAPRMLWAFDLVEANIAACARRRSLTNLRYRRSPAESLPLPAESADAVINIESSFTYDFERFLDEVARILRPDGVLLLADHRPVDDEWGELRTYDRLRDSIARSALRIERETDITHEVIAASAVMAQAKESLLREPAFDAADRTHFREILHCADSENHRRLSEGRWRYFCMMLSRNGLQGGRT